MQGMLPFVVEAEILEVQDPIPGDRNVIRYTCRAYMPDGSNIRVRNVIDVSSLGGIADYHRRRARATMDAKSLPPDFESASLDATIGERCYIFFVNGNIMNARILAYAQHPNQTDETDVDQSDEPDMVWQYLGLRAEFSTTGAFTLTHKGAPKIDYVPQGGIGGLASKALSAISGSDVGGNDNPAITPAADTEVTLVEFLDGGLFRLRDQEGQAFEMSRDNMTILISNNYIKSTLDPEGIEAQLAISTYAENSEYILIDKNAEEVTIGARSGINLTSLDARTDTTAGDHAHDIVGDSEWTIGGDLKTTVAGDVETKIVGSVDETVGSDYSGTFLGSWAVTAATGATIKDQLGGTISIENGKILIKGMTGVSLIEILSMTLDQLSQALGNLGYPLSNAPAFAALKVQLDTIKS